MDELLEYFRTTTLPTKPIEINDSITVIDPSFIDTCQRWYAEGHQEGLLFLQQYKDAIEQDKIGMGAPVPLTPEKEYRGAPDPIG